MEKEDRHKRFVRLAEARTSKVLETIDLIGNLSNKSVYAYTDEDVEKIFDAIRRACDENEAKFKTSKEKKAKKFSLKDN
ncbi:MAG: hypothetical protein PUE07_04195 [bacterium]|nr:hypothetical protein [bacterium]